MTRARGQYFPPVQSIATAVRDQPEAPAIISVPNAKQLSRSHVVSDGRQLLRLAVAGDERKGVHMTLIQPTQRQTAEAYLSQDVGQHDPVDGFAAEVPRERRR